MRSVTKREKHSIKHVIDFFEIEQNLTGMNSLLQKQNTTKLNEQLNTNISS